MSSTLSSRKTTRDEIAALFAADGSWQKTFSYAPNDAEVDGQSPILYMWSGGTAQSFASLQVNPREFTFNVKNAVIAGEDSALETPSDAEDILDALELKVVQIVRDNAGGGTSFNSLRMSDAPSVAAWSIMSGKKYRTETFQVVARLATGTAP